MEIEESGAIFWVRDSTRFFWSPDFMQQELVLAVWTLLITPSQSHLRYTGSNMLAGSLNLSMVSGVCVCCQPPTYQEYHHTIFHRPWSNSHEIISNWKEKNKGVFLFCLVLYSRTQNWWKCRAGRRIFGTRSLRGFFPQRHSYAFLEVFVHNIFQPGTHVDTLHWIWKAERFPLPGCHDGPRDYLLLLFCGRTVGRAVTLCSWKGRKFGLYCIPASGNEHWKMDSWLLN